MLLLRKPPAVATPKWIRPASDSASVQSRLRLAASLSGVTRLAANLPPARVVFTNSATET